MFRGSINLRISQPLEPHWECNQSTYTLHSHDQSWAACKNATCILCVCMYYIYRFWLNVIITLTESQNMCWIQAQACWVFLYQSEYIAVLCCKVSVRLCRSACRLGVTLWYTFTRSMSYQTCKTASLATIAYMWVGSSYQISIFHLIRILYCIPYNLHMFQ